MQFQTGLFSRSVFGLVDVYNNLSQTAVDCLAFRLSSNTSRTSPSTNVNQVIHVGSFVSTLGIDKFSIPSFTNIFHQYAVCACLTCMHPQHSFFSFSTKVQTTQTDKHNTTNKQQTNRTEQDKTKQTDILNILSLLRT